MPVDVAGETEYKWPANNAEGIRDLPVHDPWSGIISVEAEGDVSGVHSDDLQISSLAFRMQ